MTSEELKTALRNIPPGPFTIHLVEGTPIQALHTDYAMFSPDGGILNAWDAERMHWLDVRSVVRISCSRPAEPAQASL